MPPTPPVAPPEPLTPLERDALVLIREYVAGGTTVWADRQIQTLPWTLDDIQSDFGDDVYDRMLNDSQVAACAAVLKASIIEDGITVTSAVKEVDDDGFEKAKEIAAEATAMLDALEVPLEDALWDMLNGMFYGYSVAEQRYKIQRGITTNKELVQLLALKVKPRRSVAFVVDAYMNVLGLIGRLPGGGWPSITNPSPQDILPREKFAVLTFRPKNGDPRGTSILRAAFDPWWRKRQTHVELLKYLTQFAGPSIWATAPEKAKYTPKDEPDPNNPGQTIRKMMTVEEALLAALKAFKNGTVGAFPNGTELHLIQSQGEGRAFFSAIAQADQDITRAMLTQELATTTGQFQTRAASQVHQDVLDTIVQTGKRLLARMLMRDVLRPWVRYNWGENAETLIPCVSFGETESQDKPTLLNAYANLYRAGYLDDSQLMALDEALGLPPRDPESLLEPVEPAEPSGPPATAGPGSGGLPSGGGGEATASPPASGQGNQGAGGHTGMAKKPETESPVVNQDDLDLASDYWRRHAPRRYRGLIEAGSA